MVDDCKHKFKVITITADCPPVQILTCKRCCNKFYGFGGKAGHPEYIHLIKKLHNPLWFDKVGEKSHLLV